MAVQKERAPSRLGALLSFVSQIFRRAMDPSRDGALEEEPLEEGLERLGLPVLDEVELVALDVAQYLSDLDVAAGNVEVTDGMTKASWPEIFTSSPALDSSFAVSCHRGREASDLALLDPADPAVGLGHPPCRTTLRSSRP